MKKIRGLLLTICFLHTVVVMAQPNITTVKEGSLTKLLDSFLKAGLSKYDSLGIDSKLGIISIEFYNAEKQLFPMGLFPNDKSGPMPGEGKLRLRVSMIFHESFF